MKNVHGMFGALIGVFATMLVSEAVAGPKLGLTESSWIQPSVLGQLQARYEKDAADDVDFYVRRFRIVLAGQVKDGIKFFAETDCPNTGKSGTTSSSIYAQDVFADFRLLKEGDSEAWVAAGLIMLPFSFESKSSAASVLGNDYNAETIKMVNDLVWRDIGFEFHGNLGKALSARVGVFDGYDRYSTATLEKNPEAPVRVTGHVAFNLLGDAETGSFYTQERLSKGNYLSLGAGMDMQNRATRTIATEESPEPTVADSKAWVLDVQSGFEYEAMTFTVNGAYFDWDNAVFSGSTMFVEAGVKYGKTMGTAKWSAADPDGGSSTTDYTLGVHYFFEQHNAKVGVEYRFGDSADVALGSVQFLL